jgi:ergothioneine biosynthesis protein EgtB
MILKKFVPEYKVFDERFGFLFNSYYNTVGKRTARDHRGDLSRPTVKDVFAYRQHVDEKMRELMSEAPAEKAFADLVILGLNHEQQHQELLLTDLKYTLSLNPIFPVYRDDFAIEEKSVTRPIDYIRIEEGLYDIGYAGDGFCFDNELSRHKVYLNEFEIATRPATNLDYLKFILDGGYTEHRFWHSDGWEWVNQNEITAPLYWHQRDGEWFQFTLAGLRPMRWDAPVCHISYYEAAAFAEWREMRLPTEFEWEAASDKLDWGLRWEWTNSAYLPYPGFKKAAGAVGEYNGKFMINQMVLRGGSVATPEGHSRATYRNFFQPHLRWQFMGLRLAK